MRTVYFNGGFMAEDQARISIFDRAVLFGDSVYEVISVAEGRLIDCAQHLARLDRSLGELQIPNPFARAVFLDDIRLLVDANKLDEGIIYIQVTRGAGDRDFRIPEAELTPSVIMFTQGMAVVSNPLLEKGAHIVTLPDLRWGRRDIKTTQLLYPSLAYTQARRAGADDVWLVEDGFVTEAAAKTAWIVASNGLIITHQLSNAILPGVTRKEVLRLASEHGVRFVERAFTVAEAQGAAEAFMTSCGQFVTPVVSIDGHRIADGAVGPLTRKLSDLYIAHAMATAIL